MTQTNELTAEQLRNFAFILRRLSHGKRPKEPMPDVGRELAKLLPELLMAFDEDGVRGFQNACDALSIDFEIIPDLLRESPYKLMTVTELLAQPDQNWIIDGILYEDALSVLYGLPGCNKSFITLDWCCCLALGWLWQNRATKKCRVIYVAAEGARGYRRRLRAWCHHHSVDPHVFDDTLFFLPREVNLFDPLAVADFIRELTSTINEVKEETDDELPIFIVIDTVFQCAAGQNLNATDVMSHLTFALKSMKRETTALHILAIHHSGKDSARGMNGSIALKANIDISCFAESDQDGLTRLVVDRSKDDEGVELYLQREQVIYGDGPRDNSCVMVRAEKPEVGGKVNENEVKALEALGDKTLAPGAWLEIINLTLSMSRSTLTRIQRTLLLAGDIENVGTETRPLYRRRKK
jgi:AAA domain